MISKGSDYDDVREGVISNFDEIYWNELESSWKRLRMNWKEIEGTIKGRKVRIFAETLGDVPYRRLVNFDN